MTKINTGSKRPGGSSPEAGKEHRDFLAWVLEKNRKKFICQLKRLTPEQFLHIYISMVQYIMPKPQATILMDIPTLLDFMKMTPEERKDKIKELQKLL